MACVLWLLVAAQAQSATVSAAVSPVPAPAVRRVAPANYDPGLAPAVLAAIGTPPRDQALVVIYQARGGDNAGNVKVWEGDRLLGRVPIGRYLVLAYPPGPRTFRADKASKEAGTTLQLTPGDAFFLVPAVNDGFFRGFRVLLPTSAIRFQLDLAHLRPVKR
jgi:hypothetical protein